MPVAKLRPDAKGRVGLGSLTQKLEQRLNNRQISSYEASLTEDGNILLRPRVEVDAELASTLTLSNEDRDALLHALADPPPFKGKLSASLERYRAEVISE